MELRGCIVLLLFGILGGTVASAIEPDVKVSIEQAVKFLLWKTKVMEDRLSLLESRDTPGTIQKVKDDLLVVIQDAEKRTHEQVDGILKTVTGVKELCLGSKTEVLEKLQDAENRFLRAEAQLFGTVLQIQQTPSTFFEKIRSMESELKSALRTEQSEREILQITLNEVEETLNSVVFSQSDIQDAIRKDISASEEKLKTYLNEWLTRSENIQSSMTEKMSTEIINNEYLQKNDNFTKTGWLFPRVKQVEEKNALHENVINTNLRNGSSEITDFRMQLLDVQSHFDATFTLQNDLGNDTITCYSDDNYENLQFSRVLDTGKGAEMPTSVNYIKNPEGKYSRIEVRKQGVYQCKTQGSTKIITLREEGSSDIFTVNRYKVASVGDAVELKALLNIPQQLPIRWKHNGADVRNWDEKLEVTIPTVKPTDEGIYECFYEGRWNISRHAVMRLIVRKCRENFYGKDCDRICPPCYNGGLCHDEWGMCVCPAGFTGTNCEVACGKGRFGVNCTKSCNGSKGTDDCTRQFLCKPDPLGCACAPGLKALICHYECRPGEYGADCKQTCHCARGPTSCNIYTGSCEGGCSPGWSGDSCQIKDIN